MKNVSGILYKMENISDAHFKSPHVTTTAQQAPTHHAPVQGPGGGLQITGGDVADAYWKSGRGDELIEIVRYAISVGSIPMLMTHGQTLIEHPEFLERLVV